MTTSRIERLSRRDLRSPGLLAAGIAGALLLPFPSAAAPVAAPPAPTARTAAVTPTAVVPSATAPSPNGCACHGGSRWG